MKAQMKKEEPVAQTVKPETAKHEAPVKPEAKHEAPAKREHHEPAALWTNPFPTMWHWFEDMEKMMPDLGLMNRFAPRFFAPDLFTPAMRMMRETPLWNDLADMATNWTPQVEMMRRDDDLIVRLDLPGVKKEDIKVEIDNRRLIVRGERKDTFEDKREGFYRSERTYGSFFRLIPLPDDAKTDKAEAFFEDGVLEIKMDMPKLKGKGRKLDVK